MVLFHFLWVTRNNFLPSEGGGKAELTHTKWKRAYYIYIWARTPVKSGLPMFALLPACPCTRIAETNSEAINKNQLKQSEEDLMGEIRTLTEKIKKFRDERDWKQFHNHKDMALSLVLEAAEVLEHFQWKSPSEVEKDGAVYKTEIAEELADVAM
jgi:hypothetical protein